MGGITVKPDDVIKEPNASMYRRLPRPAMPPAGSVDYSLASLNYGSDLVADQRRQQQYEDTLKDTNLERKGVSDIIIAAQDELERRNQTLDYGQAMKDNMPQGPLMQSEGIPGADEQGRFDEANYNSKLADIMKKHADASKANSEGSSAKSPIEIRMDDDGSNTTIIKDPLRAMEAPFSGMLSEQQRAYMQGGRTDMQKVGPRAAEARKPVMPTGGVIKGKNNKDLAYKIANAVPQKDGTFIADMISNTAQDAGQNMGKFVFDSSGALISKAK